MQKLESQDAFKEEDRELVAYGLRLGIIVIANIISILIIGLILGMFLESVVFMLVYVPLRTYVGGYHASTELMCYFMSMLLVVVVLSSLKLLETYELQYLMLVISSLIIIILSPVESINKPLGIREKKVYKKISIHMLTAILVTLAIVNVFSGYYSMLINLSLLSVSALALLGYIVNKVS